MKLLFDENLATTDIHRGLGMKALLGIIIAILCLTVLAPAHAAKPKQVQKERLVLMPLRIPEEDKSLQGAMETALVEGLQQKYIVFSGEQVAQKAREIFLKESRNTAKKECDETRCMQGIAEAFQAELIATANVTKQDGGYFLALSVQNIFDNKVEYSKSTPCKGCDSFQVVDKLKDMSGSSVQASPSVASNNIEPAIVTSGNSNDPENSLWTEVQKGNSADDYGAYLAQYPKGKYVALAQVRIAKMKKEAVHSATQDPQPGQAFRDCPDCPEMVVIPAGSFEMGSSGGYTNELPAHRVTIGKAFAIGKTEVTQAQWKAIMGSNPSKFINCGDNCPVEQVSWNDAKDYIQKLNQKTDGQYRLPTEAEWEYACRAGGRYKYCGGDDLNNIAWYGGSYMTPPAGNSGDKTHSVATKQANAFGLYDMSGNVWEWVQDSYHDNYNGAPDDGTEWQGDGAMRVIRGGSWSDITLELRTASRNRSDDPGDRNYKFGFRLARTIP